MMGISGRYLSNPQLVSDVANGKTGGVLGFDFNGHPRAKQLKEDLMKASPQSSYDLLKFLGAVHGTRNWLYNANVLVKNGVCKIGEIPSHRDDVFMMLRDEAGMDTGIALDITNKISKGLRSGELTNNERDLLEHLELPEWFIPYIDNVHYMSSKATTIGVLRIALAFMWYKINYPDKFEM
jgi:DNA polymerase-3 subunit alpha (Gram-positive type)